MRDPSMLYICSSWLETLDKKCPFTGDISIRGRILTGKVVSTKMNRTIIIRRDYLHYIPKYSRWSFAVFVWCTLILFQTVTKSATRIWQFTCHPLSVLSLAMLWLLVRRAVARSVISSKILCAGQCRPLSKTVRFNVLRVAKNKAAAKTFGKF